MLATSLLLAGCGAVALALVPDAASAGVTPGITPDFTLNPGDEVVKDFDGVLINSAEVKPVPDDCRNSPVVSLTCAAHRIKLKRAPGYVLTITTYWDAYGEPSLIQVPDVDTFLFDTPTGHYEYDEVGGAGGTMPETIVLPNVGQDEYDLVIHEYAGAITAHKVVVSYKLPGSGKAGTTPPDFILTPDAPPITKEYTSALAMGALIIAPDDCRTAPQNDVQCDVYHLKLNRSFAKDAVNYVVLSLTWDAVPVPALSTPAIGTVGQFVPNLDMYVYDNPDHRFPAGNGGQSLRLPERVGFIATQDEYDLVIQVVEGATTGYTLTAFMTDELFDKPFELLDPVTGAPVAAGVDPDTGYFNPWNANDSSVPPLGLAPIDIDSQIAGIGLGQTEQFDAQEAIRLGGEALRNTSASHDPPSALLLLLALVVGPGVVLAAGVAVVRRRNHVAF
ncbi:MAG: hypothetical protein QOI61_640 [Actinomycetota bacterium]